MSYIVNMNKMKTYCMVSVIAGIFTTLLSLNTPAGSVFAQADNNIVVHMSSGGPQSTYEVHAANMS
jgi:hypothetical protein